MVKEPEWLLESFVKAIHRRLIAEHGRLGEIRDEGSLSSALAKPKQLWHYGKPSIFELAASYTFGISGNHPFLDGNKRVAFMTAYTFLALNGYELEAEEAEATFVMMDVAAGKMEEKLFAAWCEQQCLQKVAS